jgi:hypothetical protein
MTASTGLATVVGVVSIGLGIAYLVLATIAVHEVIHDRKVLGVSRFGIGYVLMASSCGPHHVIHGHHALMGVDAGASVAVTALLGLPPGLVFVWCRIEAAFGGRGDRFVRGTPTWLVALPVGFLLVAGAVIGQALQHGPARPWSISTWANAFVAVTYSMVAWPLLRTQFRRRVALGGWSLSGLSLSAIFPTCALMHLAYAFSAAGDVHSKVVDVWGVPASLYFLAVVRALYRDSIVDWNRRPLVGALRPAARPSPWRAPADGPTLGR